MAAIEFRNNPDWYPGAGLDKPGFATRMSAVGVEADGTIMQALAQSMWCEVRIWKACNDAPRDQPADWQHKLYIIKPQNDKRPSRPRRPTIVWLLLKDRHYEYLRLKDGAKPPAQWLEAAIHWTPPAAVIMEQEATQVVATQLDPPTQGDSQDAAGPDPKRHKANDSLDPFVGGGKTSLAGVSSCRSEVLQEMMRALCMSVRSGSVGRVHDMPQNYANARSEESVAVRRRIRGKSTAPTSPSECVAAVRRALGLSEGPGSDGRVPDVPVGNGTAAAIDCPCGWKPPPLVHRSVRQARVRASLPGTAPAHPRCLDKKRFAMPAPCQCTRRHSTPTSRPGPGSF